MLNRTTISCCWVDMQSGGLYHTTNIFLHFQRAFVSSLEEGLF